MGTRADFYVGRGPRAEWIGSVAYDGYPDGIPFSLRVAGTATAFRQRFQEFISERKDATLPAHGWPWPWEDSRTTDYAYAFDDGVVWAAYFGHRWWLATMPEPEEEDGEQDTCEFPQMDISRYARPGTPRSGNILIVS